MLHKNNGDCTQALETLKDYAYKAFRQKTDALSICRLATLGSLYWSMCLLALWDFLEMVFSVLLRDIGRIGDRIRMFWCQQWRLQDLAVGGGGGALAGLI